MSDDAHRIRKALAQRPSPEALAEHPGQDSQAQDFRGSKETSAESRKARKAEGSAMHPDTHRNHVQIATQAAAREGDDHLILGANGERSVRIVVLGIPPSGNVLRRKYRNPFSYAMLRETWKRDLWYSVSGKERDWLTGMAGAKQKMRVTISVAHKKLYDKDNLYSGVKPIVDALRMNNFLHEDSPEFCELLCSQEKINAKRTTIVIEDCYQ